MWQDWVLSGLQVVFIAALVPTMLHAHKKPTLLTGIMITAGVVVAAFTYATLALWLSAFMTAAHAIQWGVVAYQRYKIDREESKAV